MIIVPLSAAQADHVVSVLTAEIIKIMESKRAILEVQTFHGNYRLPAEHVDVDLVASEFGEVVALSQIVISVEVSRSDESRAELAEAAAAGGNFAVVVPPVDFRITAVYAGRTIEIDRFKSYIVREIPLPEGVDPSRITTAVVVEDDGAVRHVPTCLTERDGVYYVGQQPDEQRIHSGLAPEGVRRCGAPLVEGRDERHGVANDR